MSQNHTNIASGHAAMIIQDPLLYVNNKDPAKHPSCFDNTSNINDDSKSCSVDSIMENHSEKETLHSPWIHCICVVTFDIEFGQSIESMFPENVLTDKEKLSICYSSFPDSNSCINGSTEFHFRSKVSSPCRNLQSIYDKFNACSPPAIHVDKNIFYGYVHFLQRKDRTAKRGYFQKSIVIISRLPFVKLFNHVVGQVGGIYFNKNNEQVNHDQLTLHNIYQEINAWPPLITGTPLMLSILDSNVSFYIPSREDKLIDFHPNSSKHKNKLPGDSKFARRTPIVPQTNLTAYDMDLYGSFESVISDLQLLWEIVLTCEPLIVMAQTPNVCSEFVQSLVGLIWPYKYSPDYRPFFTIHDSEFRDYVGRKHVPTPNVILGVTNPFFAKSLDHWPNIVRLAWREKSAFNTMAEQNLLPSKTTFTLAGKLRFTNASSSWITNFNEDTNRSSELISKCRSFLQKDKNFLASILKNNRIPSDRPSNVQTALIRRWLVELTQSFFMPLERYLAGLMPAQRKISPFKKPPELPKFELDAFLTTLEISGPQLTTGIKGDWIGLYKKFYSSQNFAIWYQDRKAEIDSILKCLHLESILSIGLSDWIKDRDEVEVVDMIIFLRERLLQAKEGSLNLPDASVKDLEDKLKDLIGLLPPDLRPAFSKNITEFEQLTQCQ